MSKCEEFLSNIDKDPRLSKLISSISSSNKSPIIKCRPCAVDGPEAGAKAFTTDSTPNTVILCTNRNRTINDYTISLTHELIHVFDMHLNNVDMSTCNGLAYSEVRAAREAECHRTFLFQFMRNRCIRKQSIRSTNNICHGNGSKYVNHVFDDAINDKSPFHENGDDK